MWHSGYLQRENGAVIGTGIMPGRWPLSLPEPYPSVTAVKGYCSNFSVTFWQNYCYLSNFWKLLLSCITAENFGSSKFAVTFSEFPMSAKKNSSQLFSSKFSALFYTFFNFSGPLYSPIGKYHHNEFINAW